MLPWIAGAAMLLIYLFTINQWVSIRSLPVVAKVAGWDWSPPTQWPLFYIVTAPFRILPTSWIPVAMNLFSALCMALTVALLVRSVALLPHDRTDEQRIRQRSADALLATRFAWAPAVLATAVFGLTLTVWEHATSANNESLDILVFAYLIRCLLEYRWSKNERWLTKLALVYGLGVTSDWALIGFFPFFLGALVWTKGKAFFKLQFIGRMTAVGLTGMLLYAALPIYVQFVGPGNITFWDVLRNILGVQKAMVFNTPMLRAPALILSLASVVPIIIMGIRFPAGFGDVSSAGASITNFMFRMIHVLFAVVCTWVAFDQVSPRTLGRGGLQFLTFYYLGALAAGYYVGYLMLVFTEPSKKAKMWRPSSPLSKLFNPLVQTAAWAGVILVPIALMIKNFRPALSQNGKILMDFAESVASHIPDKPSILLSEDPYQLALTEAFYARRGGNPHMLVNPRALPYPVYHRDLVKRYGERWPGGGAKEDMKVRIDPFAIAAAISSLSISNHIYYLHPSFGYFFEVTYPNSISLVSELKRYPEDLIFPPALTAEQIKEHESYWRETESLVVKVEGVVKLKLADSTFVANHLSRGLNQWGVQLQRAGKFPEAASAFEKAWSLNTNNICAELNLEFNQSRVSGKPRERTEQRLASDFFGEKYRSWDAVLADNGPFDVPEYLYTQGNALLGQSLVRQAADCFRRAAELDPTNNVPKLALVTAMISGRWTNQALSMIADLQKSTTLSRGQSMDLVSMEAAVYFAQSETNRAESILLGAIRNFPNQTGFYESLNEMYRAAGQWDKSVELMGRQLSMTPTNVPLRLQRIEAAINAGNTNTASAEIAEIEKLSPGNFEAAMYQVFLKILGKDYKAALEIVDDKLRTYEGHAQAWYYKGVAHMEQKEDPKALEAFDKALKLESGLVAAVRNRAIINLRTGNLDDAKADYEKLFGIMPRSHAILYGLGEIAYQKKDKAEALKNYEGYLKFAPKDVPAEERAKVEDRVKELQGAGK